MSPSLGFCKRLLTNFALEVSPGISVDVELPNPQQRTRRQVAFQDPCAVRIDLGCDSGELLVLKRSASFTSREIRIFRSFAKTFDRVNDIEGKEYEDIVTQALWEMTIAHFLSPTHEKVILRVVSELKKWGSETYEGQPIATLIGLDLAMGAGPTTTFNDLDEYFKAPFSRVLGNGIDTMVVLQNDGKFQSWVNLPNPANMSMKAPWRFSRAAKWCTANKTAIMLARSGDLLVFQDEELVFAHRRSWSIYSHDDNIKSMQRVDETVRAAIYATCLDISQARTGGCIGLVTKSDSNKALKSLSQGRLSDTSSLKSRTLNSIISGRKFQDLDRSVRQELLGIDGAMIIDTDGTVLAGGALVQIKSSDPKGGGRSAAAKHLSKFGTGIKVSQDGSITVYRGEKPVNSQT